LLSFSWAREGASLRLRNLEARLYKGEVTGSALVPLSESAAGKVDLRIKDVDIQALAKAVPAVPLRLEGQVSGSVTAELPAAAPARPRALQTDLSLSAPRLRVEGIPTERLKGKVHYQKGKAEYVLEGEGLGGRFKLEGKLPATPKARPKVKPRLPRPG